MPAWNDLVEEFQGAGDDATRSRWIMGRMTDALSAISTLRGDRNVLFYATAFLQKPQAPVSLTAEELNGFMATVYGMDWAKGLTLLLHSPGGVTNAAETVVAYLRSKFSYVEVIVPTFAMSAGTMITLASDSIIMGRQSQLGPIDPQMPVGGRFISARAVVDQFERARAEILEDIATAHVWAPILASVGPALLTEALNALDYGETMVGRWLSKYMFSALPQPDSEALGAVIAKHFNDAAHHKSHGRRIDRDECRGVGLRVEDLEADQSLQEAVLVAYHLMTIVFESSPAVKALLSSTGRTWIKNWGMPLPLGSSS